jgi:superfamily II RNA helicase
MNAKHTATPYYMHNGFLSSEAGGEIVAEIKGATKDDAEFIVRACNRFDDLVKALEQIARLSTEGEVSANMQYALGDIARAAVHKAKGEV